MTSEQAVQLIGLVTDLKSLASAILGALGMLFGLQMFVVMRDGATRTHFWGGCLLLAACLLPNQANAEWATGYSEANTTTYDYYNWTYGQGSQLGPGYYNWEYPAYEQWKEFAQRGGNPQTHWTASSQYGVYSTYYDFPPHDEYKTAFMNALANLPPLVAPPPPPPPPPMQVGGTVDPACCSSTGLPDIAAATGVPTTTNYWVCVNSYADVTSSTCTVACGQPLECTLTGTYRPQYETAFPTVYGTLFFQGPPVALGPTSCAENWICHSATTHGCVEAAMAALGSCSAPINCNGATLECYLCALGLAGQCSTGIDCAACQEDPEPCYQICNDGNAGVDTDCDGCCDRDAGSCEPTPCQVTDPCNTQAQITDSDCDGCADPYDATPGTPGGLCDTQNCGPCTVPVEGQPEAEPLPDTDCDGCPDSGEIQPGEPAARNPACQCDVVPGSGDKGDKDCDGCADVDDADPEKNGPNDCACKDKGGDTDEDGCCDEDDAEPEEPNEGDSECGDCSTLIIDKVKTISEWVTERFPLAPEVDGEGLDSEIDYTWLEPSGVRHQWRWDFFSARVTGTEAAQFVGLTDTWDEVAASIRLLMSYCVVTGGIMMCWRLISTIGGGTD